MRWSAFLFLEEGRTFILRGRHREKTILARTFENILFLAEVFSEKADQEVPNVPILTEN